MPAGPITMNVGAMWLQRFDMLVQRGVEPRDVVEAMAKEMDQMFKLAVQLKMAAPLPPMVISPSRCPHCGKPIP